jgi:UDP-N-acetylmuramyl pentapeptide synthase
MSVMMDLCSALRAPWLAGLPATTELLRRVDRQPKHRSRRAVSCPARRDTFDGHHYVAAAQARGAAAAVVAGDAAEGCLAGSALIEVAETRLSLGALAADWRSRFTLPLIAVTGSNGKTTTKEMIASILKGAFGDACCHPGQLQQRHRPAADPAAAECQAIVRRSSRWA